MFLYLSLHLTRLITSLTQVSCALPVDAKGEIQFNDRITIEEGFYKVISNEAKELTFEEKDTTPAILMLSSPYEDPCTVIVVRVRLSIRNR
jgi:hypothetical protein